MNSPNEIVVSSREEITTLINARIQSIKEKIQEEAKKRKHYLQIIHFIFLFFQEQDLPSIPDFYCPDNEDFNNYYELLTSKIAEYQSYLFQLNTDPAFAEHELFNKNTQISEVRDRERQTIQQSDQLVREHIRHFITDATAEINQSHLAKIDTIDQQIAQLQKDPRLNQFDPSISIPDLKREIHYTQRRINHYQQILENKGKSEKQRIADHPKNPTPQEPIDPDLPIEGAKLIHYSAEIEDKSNDFYAPHVAEIISKIQKQEIPDIDTINPKDTSLESLKIRIIFFCSFIFNDPEIEQKNGFKLKIKKEQILSVLRLANEILNNQSRGSIGQVKTGEGKSFIIALLSIILVKCERKVDIVTSTSELAKRDQDNQSVYYQICGVTSGVLDRNDKRYVHSGFNIDVFQNDIVYSTNTTFEFAELFSLFRKEKLRTRPHDIVIVDEVDNMLIDQASHPAIVAIPSGVICAKEFFHSVKNMKYYDDKTLMETMKVLFPNYGALDKHGIDMLKDAAIRSDDMILDEDYIVKEGKVLIYDHSTGYISAGSRWTNYLHEMIELKEGLQMRDPSPCSCSITQKSFFLKYKSIAGVTGTLGDPNDKKILTDTYHVSLFYVPRNKPSQMKYYEVPRPNGTQQLYESILTQILNMQHKQRPVLVIFDYKKQVDSLCAMYDSLVPMHKIEGDDLLEDRRSISCAGEVGAITIATNAAGRGIDIKLSEAAKRNGGLHIIIPYCPKNQRILEQAQGRAGRQGEPGSVCMYVSPKDTYYLSTSFPSYYENMEDLQSQFDKYLTTNHSFLFQYDRMYSMDIIKRPFKSDYRTVLQLYGEQIYQQFYGREVPPEKVSNYIHDLVISAWATFYTDLLEEEESIKSNKDLCQQQYDEFIHLLNEWIEKDSHVPGPEVYQKNIEKIRTQVKKRNPLSIISEFLMKRHFGLIGKSFARLLNGQDPRNLYKYLTSGIRSPFFGPKSIAGLASLQALRAHTISLSVITSPYITKNPLYTTWSSNPMRYNIHTFKNHITNWSLDFVCKAVDMMVDSYDGFHDAKPIFPKNELYKPICYTRKEGNKLFIVTRGTDLNSIWDWLTDLSIIERIYDGHTVHGGFLQAALNVFEKLRTMISQHNGPIYLFGHSYGGAVSFILHYLIMKNFPNKDVNTITCDAPPAAQPCALEPYGSKIAMLKYDQELVGSICLLNILNTKSFMTLNILTTHLNTLARFVTSKIFDLFKHKPTSYQPFIQFHTGCVYVLPYNANNPNLEYYRVDPLSLDHIKLYCNIFTGDNIFLDHDQHKMQTLLSSLKNH